ncbi:MAG TPA: hypothetical protein VJS20_01190 [Gemmatimonadales bacterium]|nr:hypothetical protein [Gemmatimonadales bacterium]
MKLAWMVTLTLISTAVPSAAQVVPADMPAWADSDFRHSPQFSGYDYESLSPGMALADFDGDGWDDVAIEIKSRDGLQRGLALIHYVDGSVHILGAGQNVGDGKDEIRDWSVFYLRHHKAAIWVSRAFAPGGSLSWDGQVYRWVPGQ